MDFLEDKKSKIEMTNKMVGDNILNQLTNYQIYYASGYGDIKEHGFRERFKGLENENNMNLHAHIQQTAEAVKISSDDYDDSDYEFMTEQYIDYSKFINSDFARDIGLIEFYRTALTLYPQSLTGSTAILDVLVDGSNDTEKAKEILVSELNDIKQKAVEILNKDNSFLVDYIYDGTINDQTIRDIFEIPSEQQFQNHIEELFKDLEEHLDTFKADGVSMDDDYYSGIVADLFNGTKDSVDFIAYFNSNYMDHFSAYIDFNDPVIKDLDGYDDITKAFTELFKINNYSVVSDEYKRELLAERYDELGIDMMSQSHLDIRVDTTQLIEHRKSELVDDIKRGMETLKDDIISNTHFFEKELMIDYQNNYNPEQKYDINDFAFSPNQETQEPEKKVNKRSNTPF